MSLKIAVRLAEPGKDSIGDTAWTWDSMPSGPPVEGTRKFVVTTDTKHDLIDARTCPGL